jgi:peptidoglycan/LPS O-acetylase OafA/YrhL
MFNNMGRENFSILEDKPIPTKKQNEHYNSIDGLRALACLGIIMMHIQANTSYSIHGNIIYDKIIPSFTWLVYLFLIISGFGMCVGYLSKIQQGKIGLESFYKKRYRKILPFYSCLIIVAVLAEHNINAVYEGSIEILLLHGFLPNNAVSVLGVCWTLGVIFVFYLVFPAYTVLMKNKKRAWFSLGLSLWAVYACLNYFFNSYFVTESFTPRHSFIYCLPYFLAGGIIYLYRTEIKTLLSKLKYTSIILCVFFIVLWYILPGEDGSMLFYIKTLTLFTIILGYSIGTEDRVLSSIPLRFISHISMEMYLAQMVIFRLVEKCKLLYLFGDSGVGGWISYITAFAIVVLLLIITIKVFYFIFNRFMKQIAKLIIHKNT